MKNQCKKIFVQVAAAEGRRRAPAQEGDRNSVPPEAPTHPAHVRLLLRRDSRLPHPGTDDFRRFLWAKFAFIILVATSLYMRYAHV